MSPPPRRWRRADRRWSIASTTSRRSEKLGALARIPGTLDIELAEGRRRCGRRSSTASWRARKDRDAELVNEVVLRSQAQAEYAPENIGHFGLNLRRYAHFTSPIRRYADLIVHRGADPRAEARRRRSAGRRDSASSTRSPSRSRSRAPRHGGGARDRRPADRAHLADAVGANFRAAFPASPAPGCSSNWTTPARTASFQPPPWAATTTSTPRATTR